MSKPLIALTHVPSPRMNDCVRTHVAYEPIDVARATAQHDAYRQALGRAGAEVHVLDANSAHPDCVFIEDTAVVLDEIAVLTSMGNASRRAEPAGIEPALKRYRDVVRVTLPALLDGGDVIVLPKSKTILVGRTSRTDAAGIEALAAFTRRLGYDVKTVDVRGCLHLKTAATALPDGSLLVNLPWIDREDLLGHDLVPVPKDEPHAANVVCVGERVVMSAAYPRTCEIVRKRGFKVEVVDLSEFAKGEGCGTCLSLIFPG
jgi:dimethylargininase